MTPAYILPEKEHRTYRFSIFRVLFIGLMLFLLTAASLYLHNTLMKEYMPYLTSEEKKTTAFLVEQISYMLPFLAVALFQYAVYIKHDNRDGILQKEQAYEILLLAALTYLVLLPAVWIYSDKTLTLQLAAGIDIEKNEGREYETLFLDVFQWFVRLAIPLCLLFAYHMIRAGVEAKEGVQLSAVGNASDAENEPLPEKDAFEMAASVSSSENTQTPSQGEPV